MRVGNKYHGATGRYVGRGTPLGNPYRIGPDGTREEVIEKYRGWLDSRIEQGDPQVIGMLQSLHEDDTLVCFCSPKPCHANVIIEHWYGTR